MNSDVFCEIFCQGLSLSEIPMGYVLKTPFARADGDSIALYFRRLDDGLFRIEDDGMTIAFLEGAGFDVESESRFEALVELLKEYGIRLDENESLFHTEAMLESDLASASLQFVAFLLRVVDLVLLASSRVRSTFKEDLLNLVYRQFHGAFRIDTNAVLQASMKDYQVDIIVRDQDGRNLAIYAATSENKALEAMLFWREYRDQKITNTRAMLVVESARPKDIRERTFSRVLNSGLLLASMDGEEISIGNKMRENFIA